MRTYLFFFIFVASGFAFLIPGNAPGTVKIGKQEWMSNNLDVTHFRNGDPIPHITNDSAWQKASDEGKPAWCYYGNSDSLGKIYGKLYNWYAVNDPRGLAPKGWHVPSDAEYQELIGFVGGTKDNGIKLKSTWGWKEEGHGTGSGTDITGFTGLPAGQRTPYGWFADLGEFGFWWSSTVSTENPESAYNLGLLNRNGNIIYECSGKFCAYSVRCVKDAK
ncbi:MAG: fibrobacter succinogenes major paralogous domain-containing protein [Bacteroidota bacterium]